MQGKDNIKILLNSYFRCSPVRNGGARCRTVRYCEVGQGKIIFIGRGTVQFGKMVRIGDW